MFLWITYFTKQNFLNPNQLATDDKIWFFFITEQCTHTCLHISVWVCICHNACVQLAKVHSSLPPNVFTVSNSGHQARTFICWTRYGLYMDFCPLLKLGLLRVCILGRICNWVLILSHIYSWQIFLLFYMLFLLY